MLTYRNEKWDEPHLTHLDFRALFEASNQAMFVENRDGYVVALNPAACKLWRSSIDDLLGRHASEILPPKLGTSAIGTTRRSRYARPDQTVIDVEILSTPLTLGDEEAFLTTVWLAGAEVEEGEDAPGRSQAEMVPAVSAAASMAPVERLAERVAHDFNNVLTSVVGYASLVQTDHSLSETNRSYLAQIVESAQRAELMTRELLAFGHRTPPPVSSFHPATAIGRATAHIAAILGEQVSLTTIYEEDIAPIPGSEDALVHILIHLAMNTREAMEGSADGSMCIELESGSGGSVVLRVTDDGPGMDAPTAAAAFEPFFSSRTDRRMRGLGLAKVYAATRNLGGTVSLRSAPGEGTELEFTFPAARLMAMPDPPAPTRNELPSPMPAPDHPKSKADVNSESIPTTNPEPSKKRTPLPGGTETILVVEDEPMVREIVVRSLTHLGYTVHKACDGQEGLERSRELDGQIDLIFSDIVMPHLSGPEMVQRIREENRHTPVLFTTGFTESKHLLENGGDLREGIDLLQKPYTPNVLAERVREKLDSLLA